MSLSFRITSPPGRTGTLQPWSSPSNMIGAGFSLDDFYERVSYMVNTVPGSDTSRPVACITIYPHHRDLDDSFNTAGQKGSPEEYRQKLRDAVAACPHPNVLLIEGSNILQGIGGLTIDLLQSRG